MAGCLKAPVLKFAPCCTNKSRWFPYSIDPFEKLALAAFSYRSSSLLVPTNWVANAVAVTATTFTHPLTTDRRQNRTFNGRSKADTIS